MTMSQLLHSVLWSKVLSKFCEILAHQKKKKKLDMEDEDEIDAMVEQHGGC